MVQHGQQASGAQGLQGGTAEAGSGRIGRGCRELHLILICSAVRHKLWNKSLLHLIFIYSAVRDKLWNKSLLHLILIYSAVRDKLWNKFIAFNYNL